MLFFTKMVYGKHNNGVHGKSKMLCYENKKQAHGLMAANLLRTLMIK